MSTNHTVIPVTANGAQATVLITWPGYPGDASEEARRLSEAGFHIRRAPKLRPRDADQLAALLRGCSAAIVSTDPFTADVIDKASELRIIARVGVGTDSIDLTAAAARGIIVTAARGTNEYSVAEHTLGLMLATLRRTVSQDVAVRRGAWLRTGEAIGMDLAGKTVGIVGLGTTGRSVARLLSSFAVRLIGYDPAVPNLAGVAVVPLDELLRTADVISLHVPLTPETKYLLDRQAIASMKRGTVVINTARGGLIDEHALARALQRGHLAGAGLDVFELEPPVASPLLTLGDRTVLTPHIAGLTGDSIAAMVKHATTAVLDWAAGRTPDGLILPRLPSSSRPEQASR